LSHGNIVTVLLKLHSLERRLKCASITVVTDLMNKLPKILGRFTISPSFSPKQLLQSVAGYCDEAPRVLKSMKGDDYEVEASLIHSDTYQDFSVAYRKKLLDREYRLLTLRELLVFDLRLTNPKLRFQGFPIICLDFVLDFEVEESGYGTEVVRHKWIVRPAAAYHGSILEGCAGFAVTPKTLVDKGDWYYSITEGFIKVPVSSC